MSMAEIAEMADVKRPVVTTWRRRHSDFPRPVSADTGQPFFDAREIAEWLAATGRLERHQAEEDLSFYTLARLGEALPGKDLIAAVTALICLRSLEGDEPLADGTDDPLSGLQDRAARADYEDELLRSEINAIPVGCSWLAGVVDDLVEAAYGGANAFERLLVKRRRFDASGLYASAVVPELARLIAGVSGVSEKARDTGGSVLVTDLAAGPGDFLAAAARLLRDDSPMFTAAEIDPYLVRLTRRRLAVNEIPLMDLDIRVGAQLPDETGDPDVILTQVPYRPVEERSALQTIAWMDDISVRLATGKTAVILGPADILTGELKPFSAEERRRADLLKTGMVEAVIRLPGGLVPYRPGYQTAIWVLSAEPDPRWQRRVLLADVSEHSLTADVVDALIEDVVTWRRPGFMPQEHARRFAVQVSIDDLTATPKPLVARPATTIQASTTTPADTIARTNELERELYWSGVRAYLGGSPINSGLAVSAGRSVPMVTLGKLTRDGQMQLRKGSRVEAEHLGVTGNYPVLGAFEILGRRRVGARMIDILTLTKHYPRAQLTQPGDVIVTTAIEFGVMVDHEGRSLVEFPARILRISDTGRDHFTPRVLAALLADNASIRVAGSLRLARRLEEHRVPQLQPDLVARLDRLLAVLDERRRIVREELNMLDELAGLTVAGLGAGTLTLNAIASSPTIDKEIDAPA
ncbi:N-6 DNA methylase [Microtetraspora sp. NBRC 13810]|uniref:N-6 DNA methylase n=1 Tax=Microtetraspora sp. NBRC 13810 TaxID=3030990 RepID=UPI00255419A0|nr:N-6 DNA methylase [Microtetraspora sp. NBRC 13810]